MTDQLKVLDLCSGLNGWTEAFRERGHLTIGVDWDPKMPADIHADVRYFSIDDLPWRPDLILASPPCETFSVASIPYHWEPGLKPKTKAAEKNREVLRAVLHLIAMAGLPYVIENPRGMMRKFPEMSGLPRTTIWQCRYGNRSAKPTDLWVEGLPSWEPREECENGHPDHESAPRNTRGQVTFDGTFRSLPKTGTQAVDGAAQRSLIPYELSLEICEAAEKDLLRRSPMPANAPVEVAE